MRIAAAAVATFVATIVLGLAAHQCDPFFAYQRLQDLDWYRTAPPTEQRATAHKALEYLFGDPHEAFAVLENHADRSSIPHLRAALAHEPKEEHGAVECTWLHGRRALDRALKAPK